MTINTDAYRKIASATYISVTTYRKSGQPVATPVWFAEVDGKLYFETATHAGKIKRIRNNPRVTVAPCGPSGNLRGAPIETTAQIISDESPTHAIARNAIVRKYNILRTIYYFGMNTVARLRGHPPETTVFVMLTPT